MVFVCLWSKFMQSLSLNPTQSMDWTHHLSHLRPTLNTSSYKLSTITHTNMTKGQAAQNDHGRLLQLPLSAMRRQVITYLLSHTQSGDVCTSGENQRLGCSWRHPFFHPTEQLTLHYCCGRSSSMTCAWLTLFQLLSAGRQPWVSFKAKGWPWSTLWVCHHGKQGHSQNTGAALTHLDRPADFRPHAWPWILPPTRQSIYSSSTTCNQRKPWVFLAEQHVETTCRGHFPFQDKEWRGKKKSNLQQNLYFAWLHYSNRKSCGW